MPAFLFLFTLSQVHGSRRLPLRRIVCDSRFPGGGAHHTGQGPVAKHQSRSGGRRGEGKPGAGASIAVFSEMNGGGKVNKPSRFRSG